MQSIFKRIIWSVSSFVLLVPLYVFGVGTRPPDGGAGAITPPCSPDKLCNPIKYGNLEGFLIAILDVIVQYGAIIIVFFVVYAGFQFVTAQGNTEKLEHAKKMLVWIIVGGFVLLGAFVIRAAICGTLTNLGVENLQC